MNDLITDWPEPFSIRGSSTRVEAAKAIEPVAGRLRKVVLTWLVERGAQGGTDEEMQAALDMAANTQRPRRIELTAAGRVKDSGQTRPTRSGRKAVVWQAV
jgi:hypothetical protein